MSDKKPWWQGPGAKAAHLYDTKLLFADYLESVIEGILRFPEEEHRVEFPDGRIAVVRPQERDVFVEGIRELVRELRGVEGCEFNLPVGELARRLRAS